MQVVINVDEKDVEFVKENFKPTGYSSIPLSIQTEFISAVLNGVPDSFMNKPCISSEVCEHDKNKVLDKIRAEIEQTVINVVRKFDVDVNKDELIKALNYDRNQYNKGYKDGADDTLNKLRTEIADLADYDAFNDTQQAFNLGLMKAVEIIDKCRGGRALLKKG